MMPSRTALVLLSCMTCLGFARSGLGAPLNGYSTAKSSSPAIETATTNFILASASEAIVAQANSPKPTNQKGLADILPSLDLKKQTPSPTPKKVAQPSKSSWPLWWIASGAVLVVIAGGLLYLLRNPGEQAESAEENVLPEGDSSQTDEVENFSSEANEFKFDSHLLDTDRNGYRAPLWPIEENQQLQQPTPPADTNGDTSIPLSSISEDKKIQQPTPPPQANSHNYTNSISSVTDNKQIEEQIPPPAAEALEVREPTRLAKINIIDELIKDLQNPDPTKRRKAIWELAQRGDSRAMQPLLELLMDADSKQRSLILEALSQIGNRTLKPMNRALAISLQDDNAEVRKNAIRDLTRIYDMMAQATQLLRHAVDDPDVEVQETARWALNQLGRIRGISGVDSFPNWPNSNKNSSEN